MDFFRIAVLPEWGYSERKKNIFASKTVILRLIQIGKVALTLGKSYRDNDIEAYEIHLPWLLGHGNNIFYCFYLLW